MDDDGALYHAGAMLDEPEVYHFFLSHLCHNMGDERAAFPYVLICAGERNLLAPTSSPYVVQSLCISFEEVPESASLRASPDRAPTSITLICQGGYEAPLMPDTLSTDAAHVLYARVRDGAFPARFSRKAYYDLARFMVEVPQGYALRLTSGDTLIRGV